MMFREFYFTNEIDCIMIRTGLLEVKLNVTEPIAYILLKSIHMNIWNNFSNKVPFNTIC